MSALQGMFFSDETIQKLRAFIPTYFNTVLRYKLVNQQRLINQVLTQEKQAQRKIQLTSILKGDADISYTELLGLFPEIEAELVLEDLIESGQLKRQMRRRQKKQKKN